MKITLKKTGPEPINVKPSYHNIKTYAQILALRALRSLVAGTLLYGVIDPLKALRYLLTNTGKADIPNIIICLLGALGLFLYYFTGSATGLMR
jgi:hypothetical protein